MTLADADEFVAAACASVELHHPWASAPTTQAAFVRYVEALAPQERGFVVRECSSGALVGYVNIKNVMRGSYQRAVLGYGVFVPYQQRGLMSEGVQLAIRHAFGELGLHRLEAEIHPENQPSIRLVQRLGFQYEGLARGLIRLGGAWTHHERWALLADDRRPGR